MKILMNVEQKLIFAIRMQFVGIPWGVTFVTAKKMATGMVTDLTATITIHVGIGQGSMDYKFDPCIYRQNICFYISVVIRPYIYRVNISPKLKS